MNGHFKRLACAAALLVMLGQQGAAAGPAGPSTLATPVAKETKHMHAAGLFDVKLAPQAPAPEIAGAGLGRMTINKQFHGELDAASLGEMLAVQTAVQGSAGYVALERVTGILSGRQGSFVLQHSGTMNRGAPSLVLTVVPDSGTGELTGLSGAMSITITQGQHYYALDYMLPE